MESSRVEDLLSPPILLTDQIGKSVEEADSYRQECQELWTKVEKMSTLLKKAARIGHGNLYGRPTRRIMVDVEKTLEKSLALVRKCKRSGILKRVITITSAADFKKANMALKNSIADVEWLLNVSAVGEDRPDSVGVPPIAITEPVLAMIWEQIAVVQVGSQQGKMDGASMIASIAADNDRNGKLIIEEGGVPPLLRLLKEGNVTGQEAAAQALGVLARDLVKVKEILEANAVEVFVGILTPNHSMKVQVKVAWALAQMVSNSPEAQDQFAQAGAIRLLVTLLAYDTLEETKFQKATNFHTLVKTQKEWAQNSGALAKPVDGEEGEQESSRGRGSKPVDGMSMSSKPHTTGATESSRLGPPMKPVSGHTKPGPGLGVNRSSSFDNYHDHRHHGHSRHRQERDREDPETKQKLKAEAARAIWKLAVDNVKNSKSITDTRALLCFAKLIESGEGEVRLNSVMAVMEIARAAEKDPELRRAAFKTNSPAAKAVVDQLLKLVVLDEPELQIPCIRAIGCLARIFPAPADNKIKPLTAQLASNDGWVAEEAAIALQKFVDKNNYLRLEHSRTILDYSGAGNLVQLIYVEPQAKVEAVVLLSHLAINVGDKNFLDKEASLAALEAASRWPELQDNYRMLVCDAIETLESCQVAPRALPEGANFLV